MVVYDDNDDDNDSGGDNFDANCNKHNDKNEALSSMSKTNNTITSSFALVHTATSQKFVEESDDDDADDLFLAQV